TESKIPLYAIKKYIKVYNYSKCTIRFGVLPENDKSSLPSLIGTPLISASSVLMIFQLDSYPERSSANQI
uniref:hypothetical protein n=1 Tax=Odoribacter laneus TaxID=626933 RepID=UPI003AF7C565